MIPLKKFFNPPKEETITLIFQLVKGAKFEDMAHNVLLLKRSDLSISEKLIIRAHLKSRTRSTLLTAVAALAAVSTTILFLPTKGFIIPIYCILKTFQFGRVAFGKRGTYAEEIAYNIASSLDDDYN